MGEHLFMNVFDQDLKKRLRCSEKVTSRKRRKVEHVGETGHHEDKAVDCEDLRTRLNAKLQEFSSFVKDSFGIDFQPTSFIYFFSVRESHFRKQFCFSLSHCGELFFFF